MTDLTEAAAREKLETFMQDMCALPDMVMNDVEDYAEAVRATERESHAQNLSTAVAASFSAGAATEREKVRALVERLASKARCGCGLASIDYGEVVPHVEDCPWVEARLWLDGGAECATLNTWRASTPSG